MRRFPLTWVFLAIILLAAALIRLCILHIPLERDEGEYAYAGQLILQGHAPYSLAFNMKLPGTYAAHALIMALFGQTIAGIHFGLILVNAATILLVFFLGRRLFGPAAGVAAAAAYASLSLSPDVGGTASHATHFVTLCALAGTVLLLRRPGAAFWPGVLYGLAFLMKQHGVFYMFFGAIYLLRHRSHLRTLAAYCAGAVLPYALTSLLLWRAGVFPTFWFWTVSYARTYATRVPLSTGLGYLSARMQTIWAASPALWVIALIGLCCIVWRREARPRAIFALAFLAFSFATAWPGLLFREHYFIPTLPAIALLAGAAAWLAASLTRSRLPYLVFAAAVIFPFVAEREFYFSLTPTEAAQETWGEDNPFPEAVEAAGYIRAHTAANTPVGVLGSEPEIFFYSQRHSATPYIYMYALMEPQLYAVRMQNDVIHDFESSRPEYIVHVNSPKSWLVRDSSAKRILDWWPQYQRQQYELVKSFGDLAIYRRRP